VLAVNFKPRAIMKFLNILLGVAAAGSALAAPPRDAPSPTTKNKRASKFEFVGVNESGAEFGKDSLPGQLNKHYIWPTKSSIDVSLPVVKHIGGEGRARQKH
jgi:endoglucanase